MSRNSMETCIGGSLLASFPRDFPRENEEGSKEGWNVHGPPGKEAGIPRPAGRGETERGRSRKSSGAVLEAS